MIVLIYVLILASVMMIGLFLALLQGRSQLTADLKIQPKHNTTTAKDKFIKTPLFFTLPLMPLNRVIASKLNRQALLDKLNAAEINLLPEDFLGLKELFIAGLLFGAFNMIKPLQPVWVVAIVVAGFLLPDIYVKMRIRKRNQQIIKYLPDVIDLMTLCVGGGMDFMQGMDWVIQRSKPNPFVKELALVAHEIKVGKSRQEAFKAMARRLNVPEVFSFVNMLVAADRMGSPIYEVLNNLGEETRRQRFQRGERLALQAPIKMLFPLIFFILPVVAIIVGGPILIRFMQGGLTSGLGSGF